MKAIIHLFLALLLLAGCTPKETQQKGFPPMEALQADSVTIPPVLLAVTRLFVANDMLVAYQQRNDTLFSFFGLPACNYLFAAGTKGQGPDDFLMLDRSFQEMPRGFKTFEIASNRVKEIRNRCRRYVSGGAGHTDRGGAKRAEPLFLRPMKGISTY